MLLQKFPDINWLKKQIRNGFATGKDWNGNNLAHTGWPTVFLNVQTNQASRPDLQGPFSIFTNISGQSRVTVEGRETMIEKDFFYISNQEQHYSLNIDSSDKVETFNIHLSDHFANQAFNSLVSSPEDLLDNQFDQTQRQVNFSNRLYRRDSSFNLILNEIYSEPPSDPFHEEERLLELVTYLFAIRGEEIKKLQNIPAVKSSTKTEISRRLFWAVDYMHTFYNKPLNLDEVGRVALLSKFYFVRLFKLVFNQSPHQYITDIRITKTLDLLRNTNWTLNQIAVNIGLENASSLSRLFYKKIGCYPSVYRRSIKN